MSPFRWAYQTEAHWLLRKRERQLAYDWERQRDHKVTPPALAPPLPLPPLAWCNHHWYRSREDVELRGKTQWMQARRPERSPPDPRGLLLPHAIFTLHAR